jgi:hypothetical protein
LFGKGELEMPVGDSCDRCLLRPLSWQKEKVFLLRMGSNFCWLKTFKPQDFSKSKSKSKSVFGLPSAAFIQ